MEDGAVHREMKKREGQQMESADEGKARDYAGEHKKV